MLPLDESNAIGQRGNKSPITVLHLFLIIKPSAVHVDSSEG